MERPRKCVKGVSYARCKSIDAVSRVERDEDYGKAVSATPRTNRRWNKQGAPANPLHQHTKENIQEYVDDVLGGTKRAMDTGAITEAVRDNPTMNKYAHLANSSYDLYEGKDPTEGLKKAGITEYTPVEHLNLNKNNLVLESAKSKEIHISFRGSMETKDWTNVNSRILTKTVFGDVKKTGRYVEAEQQLKRAMDYAKGKGYKLTTSGHSAGGHISYDLAQKYDVEGHHYQPGITMRQVRDTVENTFAKNKSTQNVYKTHFDLPSLRVPQFHKAFKQSPDTKINYVGTKPALDNSLVKTHSVEHFTTNPTNVRNTPASSMIKSMSLLTSVGVQGVFAYQDVKKDQQTRNKVTNSTVDVAKNVTQLAGGLAIGAAFAPELVVPAMITTAMFNYGVEHMAHEIKTTGVEDANVLKHALVDDRNVKGESISQNIKQSFAEKNKAWEHRVTGAANTVAGGVKDAANAVGHLLGV
jgi:hypothetical protein